MAPRGELAPDWSAAEFMALARSAEASRSVYESRLIADYIAVATKPLPSPSLLDVGCGWGRLHRRLAELGVLERVRYTGLEHGQPVVDAARRVLEAEIVEGSATRIPFADGSFDVVASMSMLETLPAFESALDEMLRVSRWIVVIATTASRSGRAFRGHRNTPGVGWHPMNLWDHRRLRRHALASGAAYAWSLNDAATDDPALPNISVLLTRR